MSLIAGWVYSRRVSLLTCRHTSKDEQRTGDVVSVVSANTCPRKALESLVYPATCYKYNVWISIPLPQEELTCVMLAERLARHMFSFPSGARKTVTRGVNIENADFHDKDMSGVSFQQSLVRGTNFKDAKLVAAGIAEVNFSRSMM